LSQALPEHLTPWQADLNSRASSTAEASTAGPASLLFYGHNPREPGDESGDPQASPQASAGRGAGEQRGAGPVAQLAEQGAQRVPGRAQEARLPGAGLHEQAVGAGSPALRRWGRRWQLAQRLPAAAQGAAQRCLPPRVCRSGGRRRAWDSSACGLMHARRLALVLEATALLLCCSSLHRGCRRGRRPACAALSHGYVTSAL